MLTKRINLEESSEATLYCIMRLRKRVIRPLLLADPCRNHVPAPLI